MFDYQTGVVCVFDSFFSGCTYLTTIPADLFRNTTLSVSYAYLFYECRSLQLRDDIFFRSGEENTRFLNKTIVIQSSFAIGGAFLGTQGVAPALWTCSMGTGGWSFASSVPFNGHSTTSVSNYLDIPVYLNINVAPSSDWVAGDVITGQTSGATANALWKVSALKYSVNNRNGLYWTIGEIIGIVGNLADQNSGAPTMENFWRVASTIY
jgi:hypothetical protein